MRRFRVAPRVSVLATAILVWATAVPASFAEEPRTNKTASKEPAYGFPAYVPSDRDTLIVIRDPWPYVEHGLRTSALVDAVLDCAEVIQGKRPEYDADTLLARMAPYRAFVPLEIAIGCTSESLGRFTEIIRAGVSMGLCSATLEEIAESGGDAALAARMAELQKKFEESLRRWSVPDATLYVRFANPAAASLVFGAMRPMWQQIAATSTVQHEPGEKWDRLRVRMKDAIDKEMAAQYLVALGLASDARDDRMAPMVEALLSKSSEMRIDVQGDAIVVMLGGHADDAPGFDLETLQITETKSGSAGSPWIASTWDASHFKISAAAALSLWNQWESKELGRRVRAADVNDTIGSLEDTAKIIRMLPDRGTMQVDIHDGLDVVICTQGAPSAPSLASTSLLQWIPHDPGMICLDSRSSLGGRVAGWMRNFEDRIAARLMRYEWSGDEAQARNFARLEQGYYEKLGEVRSIVLEEGREIFTPPSAILIGTKGRVREFEAFNRLDSSGAAEDATTVKNFDVPEFAMIGRCARDADAVHTYFGRIWGACVRAFLDEDHRELLGKSPHAVAVDLGLGVKTWSFRPLYEAFGTRFTVDGDLLPHVFEQGEWVFFSTSPRLSHAILAAKEEEKRRWSLPSDHADAIALSRGLPDALASTVHTLARAIDQSDDLDTKETVRNLEAIADLIRSIETWESMAHEDGSTRVTRHRIAMHETTGKAEAAETELRSARTGREDMSLMETLAEPLRQYKAATIRYRVEPRAGQMAKVATDSMAEVLRGRLKRISVRGSVERTDDNELAVEIRIRGGEKELRLIRSVLEYRAHFALRIVATESELARAGVNLEAEAARRGSIEEKIARGMRIAPYAGPRALGFGWKYQASVDADGEESPYSGAGYYLVLDPDRSFDARDVERVYPTFDAMTNKYAVGFGIAEASQERFGRVTESSVGRQLAIVIDDFVDSAPTLRSRLEGEGIITGGPEGFSRDEQDDLLAILYSAIGMRNEGSLHFVEATIED